MASLHRGTGEAEDGADRCLRPDGEEEWLLPLGHWCSGFCTSDWWNVGFWFGGPDGENQSTSSSTTMGHIVRSPEWYPRHWSKKSQHMAPHQLQCYVRSQRAGKPLDSWVLQRSTTPRRLLPAYLRGSVLFEWQRAKEASTVENAPGQFGQSVFTGPPGSRGTGHPAIKNFWARGWTCKVPQLRFWMILIYTIYEYHWISLWNIMNIIEAYWISIKSERFRNNQALLGYYRILRYH